MTIEVTDEDVERALHTYYSTEGDRGESMRAAITAVNDGVRRQFASVATAALAVMRRRMLSDEAVDAVCEKLPGGVRWLVVDGLRAAVDVAFGGEVARAAPVPTDRLTAALRAHDACTGSYEERMAAALAAVDSIDLPAIERLRHERNEAQRAERVAILRAERAEKREAQRQRACDETHGADAVRLIAERDAAIARAEKAEAELAAASAFRLAIAEAVGKYHDADGHPRHPADDETLVEEAKRLSTVHENHIAVVYGRLEQRDDSVVFVEVGGKVAEWCYPLVIRQHIPAALVRLVEAATPIVDSMQLDDGIGWIFSASPQDVERLRSAVNEARDLCTVAASKAGTCPVATSERIWHVGASVVLEAARPLCGATPDEVRLTDAHGSTCADCLRIAGSKPVATSVPVEREACPVDMRTRLAWEAGNEPLREDGDEPIAARERMALAYALRRIEALEGGGK